MTARASMVDAFARLTVALDTPGEPAARAYLAAQLVILRASHVPAVNHRAPTAWRFDEFGEGP